VKALSSGGQFSACGGITTVFIDNLKPHSFSGLTSTCIGQSQSNAWRLVTAEKIAAIPPDSVAAFSQQQTSFIPANAFTGFTPEQVRFFHNKGQICLKF